MLKASPSKVKTAQKAIGLLAPAFRASQIQLNDETCLRKRPQIDVLSICSKLVRTVMQVIHYL